MEPQDAGRTSAGPACSFFLARCSPPSRFSSNRRCGVWKIDLCRNIIIGYNNNWHLHWRSRINIVSGLFKLNRLYLRRREATVGPQSVQFLRNLVFFFFTLVTVCQCVAGNVRLTTFLMVIGKLNVVIEMRAELLHISRWHCSLKFE